MMTALRRGLLVLLAVLPMFSHAALSAHQVIQKTTDELLADLKANKEQYRNDPSAFYDSLNEILGPVVDADGISRSIMTVKYSRSASRPCTNVTGGASPSGRDWYTPSSVNSALQASPSCSSNARA